MKTKWAKYAGAALLWAGVGAAVLCASRRVERHDAGRRIAGVGIEILDSTAHGQLVTREMVRSWIAASEKNVVGRPVREFDLGKLERTIARNGFVGRVRASIDYSDTLRVDIRQRSPLMRLLVDGYNLYVTDEGYLFSAPVSSSIYVPVVTGSYRPPFEADCEGWLDERLQLALEKSVRRMEELETEKYPFYRRERRNIEYNRETRRMRVKKGLLENREHFRGRVEELLAEKRDRRRRYRYEQQQIRQGLDRVERRLAEERARQKKLEKNYEDFSKLITFVRQIDRDAFWRSEIVQIVASTAHSGALELEFVPRSGRYTVRFGRLEREQEKLELLERFCRSDFGASSRDEWRTVDVRFANRVVCSEK